MLVHYEQKGSFYGKLRRCKKLPDDWKENPNLPDGLIKEDVIFIRTLQEMSKLKVEKAISSFDLEDCCRLLASHNDMTNFLKDRGCFDDVGHFNLHRAPAAQTKRRKLL